jgi:hypothetical protein
MISESCTLGVFVFSVSELISHFQTSMLIFHFIFCYFSNLRFMNSSGLMINIV